MTYLEKYNEVEYYIEKFASVSLDDKVAEAVKAYQKANNVKIPLQKAGEIFEDVIVKWKEQHNDAIQTFINRIINQYNDSASYQNFASWLVDSQDIIYGYVESLKGSAYKITYQLLESGSYSHE